MSKRIKTDEEYKALFAGDKTETQKKSSGGNMKGAESESNPIDKAKLALEYALEIRKFEIDLYWKRTAYFWTLITVAFAGYFTVGNEESNSLDAFIIACLGLVLSVAWYLVNRGSKFWQENWEMHVDALENDCMGPLYKTTRSRQEVKFWHLHKGYPFSVSKVNQLVSLFATVAWFLLIMKVIPRESMPCLDIFYEHQRFIFAGATLAAIASLFLFSNGKKSKWERRVDFEYNKLKGAKK